MSGCTVRVGTALVSKRFATSREREDEDERCRGAAEALCWWHPPHRCKPRTNERSKPARSPRRWRPRSCPEVTGDAREAQVALGSDDVIVPPSDRRLASAEPCSQKPWITRAWLAQSTSARLKRHGRQGHASDGMDDVASRALSMPAHDQVRPRMPNSRLDVIPIWRDSDMIEVRVQAANDSFSGARSVYVRARAPAAR